MSKVKRYDQIIHNGVMEPMPDGKYVTYSDYQKLVAENVALKDSANFYRMGFKPTKGAFGIEYKPTEALLDDCGNNAMNALKTPVPDAAIAEIVAKAVEAEFSRTPDAEIKWDGTNLTVQNVRDGFSFGVTPVFVAANLRAGRKG